MTTIYIESIYIYIYFQNIFRRNDGNVNVRFIFSKRLKNILKENIWEFFKRELHGILVTYDCTLQISFCERSILRFSFVFR